MKKLKYIGFFIKNSWFVFRYRFFHKKKSVTRFMGQKNITLAYSNEILKQMILSNEPFSAVRFGAVELSCVNNHEKIQLGFKKKYKVPVIYSIKNGAGVFPTTKESLDQYSMTAIQAFSDATILGISGVHMEDYFYKKYASKCRVIQYEAFEPLRGDWIQALKGKKVLVISPFANDIQKQYDRIDLVFEDGKIPQFDLQVFQCVQTLAEEKDSRFTSWNEALSWMEEEISKLDFDIALVGAGAYGSPLCSFIAKTLHRQAIQTGGATQTMFGIIGKRWEKREHVAKYINEYWIRPTLKPKGYENVEKGCYW
ncbi:uncharacterized protein BN794_00959 [Coprobacillus sp. CAG:826]|nr:uncharacterized protein BN794_00959 [Coprobacillus sp. CAG:826]